MNCRGATNDSCLEFSSSSVEQLPCTGPIASREASTVCLNSITQIQYTLITASSADCPDNGAKFQFPQLQYRWRNSGWITLTVDYGK